MKIINELYILGENAQDNWNILDKVEPNHYFFHLTSFSISLRYIIMRRNTVN